jgi:DNA-directed RNA polymerase specialized sigma24 family protein
MACGIDLDLIRRRLDTLPMATRAVFLLLRFDDLDYGQIAWRLGIGIEEVERHVARAMLVLTWGIDEEGRDEAAGASPHG